MACALGAYALQSGVAAAATPKDMAIQGYALPSDKPVTIVLMRPNVTVGELQAGGLPQPLNHMPYALLTDPAAPGHLYAGLSHGEVWHTADHGDTWQMLPLNLGHINRALILLPVP